MQSNIFGNAKTEDPLQEAALGRPTVHQHYALYTKQSDTLWKKIISTRDLFYQSHWDTLEIVKSALKGAFLLGTVGSAIWTSHFYEENTYLNRKAANWGQHQPYGMFKLFWRYNKQFYGFGALTGAAWYVWWNLGWSGNGQNTGYLTYIGGFSTFTALVSAFYHPRMAPKFFLLGGWIGFCLYHMQQGQFGLDKTQVGFTFEIPSMNDEQKRKEQKEKDFIFLLGQAPHIKLHEVRKI